MTKYNVKIDGMSCNHCVGHVKSAFEGNENVTSLNVEIGLAVIEGEITENEIKDIIEDEGYDIVEITNE
ncbi:MAG: heavy-metal-associated domain-containing protein [Clostridium sp.]